MEIKKIYSVVGNSYIDGEGCFGSFTCVYLAEHCLKRVEKQKEGLDWFFHIDESYALYADGRYFQLTEIEM